MSSEKISVNSGDEAACPICGLRLDKAKIQAHFQQCLSAKFQHKPSSGKIVILIVETVK